MYSVALMLALTPATPVAVHKVTSGCVGTPAKAAAGCYGSVKAAPAAGCYGSVAARSYRTPVRSFLHRATAPRGTTTYLPVTAVYVPAATSYQSAAPPVYRTPVRTAASAIVPRRCPVGGRCP